MDFTKHKKDRKIPHSIGAAHEFIYTSNAGTQTQTIGANRAITAGWGPSSAKPAPFHSIPCPSPRLRYLSTLALDIPFTNPLEVELLSPRLPSPYLTLPYRTQALALAPYQGQKPHTLSTTPIVPHSLGMIRRPSLTVNSAVLGPSKRCVMLNRAPRMPDAGGRFLGIIYARRLDWCWEWSRRGGPNAVGYRLSGRVRKSVYIGKSVREVLAGGSRGVGVIWI